MLFGRLRPPRSSTPVVPRPRGEALPLEVDTGVLAEYGLPEHAPVEALRAITSVAAALCDVPSAVVNLLDGCFQHQVGSTGGTDGPQDFSDSMCGVAVREPRLRYLPDATLEPAFAGNPFVHGPSASVRLYASAPLVVRDGRVLGTLCVHGPTPGQLRPDQLAALASLADQAVALVEQSRDAREAGRQAALFRLIAEGSADVLSRHRMDGTLVWVSPSVRAVLGSSPEDVLGSDVVDRVHPDDAEGLRDAVRSVGATGAAASALVRVAHADGSWRWLECSLGRIRDADGSGPELHCVARDVSSRVAADRARSESEHRYRELVEQTTAALVVHVDGFVVYANTAAAQLLRGERAADLLGLPMIGVTDPELSDLPGERVVWTSAGEDSGPRRRRLRRLDGTWVQVEMSDTPVEFDGQLGVQCVIRDTTEQEATREALRASAEQHRVLFEEASVGMAEADPAGIVLRANAALADMLGFPGPEALVGRPAGDLLVPDARPERGLTQALLAAQDLDRWDQDRAVYRADGRSLEVAMSGRVLRDAAGRPARYLVTLVDMTERVAARHALEAANADLVLARDEAERRGALTAAVLDTIDVGIVACDADGRLTLFNRASRDFHGVAEDGTLTSAEWARAYSLYTEDGAPMTREEIPLVRALTEGEVRDALLVIAPPGRPALTVRCDGKALRDTSGRLLGAVTAQADVTEARARQQELVEARDQALAATRAKTSFLAAASHEIRTPLNGVLGMLEVLSLEPLTPRQSEFVEVAHRSGQLLLQLLNDVLDLSKAETTSVQLTHRPFSPAEVAGDVVAALQPVAARKHLALDLVVGRDDLLGGDPSRLRQVLMNLVGNAVKFTDRGGVRVDVDVAPRADARVLRVSVHDTGAGMDAEEVGRVFTPFVQGEQGVRSGGTGLGLALSRQLVELMGGRLDAVSEPGRGSTFTVEVALQPASPSPDSTPAPEAAVPQEDQPPAVRPSRPRVLVADDNEVNLMVAEALLAAEGVDVVTVADGEQAVQAVCEGAFDLVLLDVQMPRMSGLEAARAIRAPPGRAAGTRLVALTAGAADDDRSACRSAGMEQVLVKPVTRAQLRAVLAEDGVPDTPPAGAGGAR